MSRFRLTEVADNTRASQQYWDKRNEDLWGRQMHGHFLDDPSIIKSMDEMNLNMIMHLSNVIKRKTGRKTDVSVLEAACGVGRYANVVTQWFDKYVGIDFAIKNIEAAKEQYENKEFGIEFFHSDMLSFSTKEKFDLIFMVAAMSSIEENSKEIIEHLSFMLKPGGCIAVFEQDLFMVKWR